jgi:hypothetical protein
VGDNPLRAAGVDGHAPQQRPQGYFIGLATGRPEPLTKQPGPLLRVGREGPGWKSTLGVPDVEVAGEPLLVAGEGRVADLQFLKEARGHLLEVPLEAAPVLVEVLAGLPQRLHPGQLRGAAGRA